MLFDILGFVMKSHLTIIVKGKVQGVYFRRDTQIEARKLGVTGTVANQEDGSVIIHAEAETGEMEAFVAWCHNGPELANVAEVETSKNPSEGFTSFEVLAAPSDFLS
ncbi:MAG: acylphosphatase [Alteromonas macleodii]